MKKILLLLIILSFLIGAFSVLAQDTTSLPSVGITPDSPFYIFKTLKESIQTFFIFGAENKAKQYLHLAEVRLAEYQKMLEKGKNDIAQKTLDKYGKQLNNAVQKIEELKNKGINITKLSEYLSTTTSKSIEVLERNLQKVPEPAKKGIENALDKVNKIFKESKIEKVKEKNEKEQGCINSGGEISTSLCCKSTDDFPNACLIGACGCSSDNSKEIKTCDCGIDKCFNGKECVSMSEEINKKEGNETTSLEFSTGKCDSNIDSYSGPVSGILSQTWSDNTLLVEAYLKTYCGGAVISGSYEVKDNSLILEYKVKISGPVTTCVCTHKLIYKISKLEKKDYQISLIENK